MGWLPDLMTPPVCVALFACTGIPGDAAALGPIHCPQHSAPALSPLLQHVRGWSRTVLQYVHELPVYVSQAPDCGGPRIYFVSYLGGPSFGCFLSGTDFLLITNNASTSGLYTGAFVCAAVRQASAISCVCVSPYDLNCIGQLHVMYLLCYYLHEPACCHRNSAHAFAEPHHSAYCPIALCWNSFSCQLPCDCHKRRVCDSPPQIVAIS